MGAMKFEAVKLPGTIETLFTESSVNASYYISKFQQRYKVEIQKLEDEKQREKEQLKTTEFETMKQLEAKLKLIEDQNRNLTAEKVVIPQNTFVLNSCRQFPTFLSKNKNTPIESIVHMYGLLIYRNISILVT